MRYLSVSEIKAADDLKYEDVACPEWGEDAGVRIKSLSAKGLLSIHENAEREGKNLRYALIRACAVDADGAPLFATDADIEMLEDKSYEPVIRLYDACSKLNGLSQKTEEIEGKS